MTRVYNPRTSRWLKVSGRRATWTHYYGASRFRDNQAALRALVRRRVRGVRLLRGEAAY